SAINDAIEHAVGLPRAGEYWPIRSLIESGALLAAGSDWPSVVPSMDPWVGIEAMITRQDPQGKRKGSLWQEQAITLEQALKIYTLNGAAALRLEQQTGSIELGKSADLIVLNHHLFKIAAQQISETKVLYTFFAGNNVYQQK
ncbi:MAG: amidohydrolase, partial [Gammaproteobacteria bacterium]